MDVCGRAGMGLVSLRVEHLRNIQGLEFDTKASLVVLTGANGAGKTTVLEAIYLLARGRSFRGRKAGPLTTNGESFTRVEGMHGGPDADDVNLVFRRDRAGSQRLVDRIPYESQFAPQLPLSVKLIGENSQALLEGDPSLRRTFLDWNVFHVEPRLGRLRKDFRRVLMQRNAAIRDGGMKHSIWDRSFVELSDAIHVLRARFFADWRSHFLRLSQSFPFLDGCDLHYRRGWSEQGSLMDSLEQIRSSEISRGYTLIGPSRADFCLTRQTGALAFSRGQAKIIVCLLQLAADWTHRAKDLDGSIWLLDDLEAELDLGTARKLWGLFESTGSQCFATRVSETPERGSFDSNKIAMFHVEHGTLSACH